MDAPPNAVSMNELADRYSAELQSQFRTLNLFVQHAGEIGRSHEVFIRGILSRFLPGKLRCGTGFISTDRGVSRQQDLIIYDAHSLPLLFQVGDCVVVDGDAVAATIEVKTSLTSKSDLRTAIEGVGGAKSWFSGCAALFIWEGLSVESVEEAIWEHFRDQDRLSFSSFPDAIYVNGRFLIVPNLDWALDTSPLRLLKVEDGHNSQGAGLLTLVERMWLSGLQSHARWPRWLSAWSALSAASSQAVHWPEDLRPRALEHQAEILQSRRLPKNDHRPAE